MDSEGFPDFDSLHGTHFLTAEAGNTAFLLKMGFMIFDFYDMRRAALGAFSTADAFFRDQFRIGLENGSKECDERLLQERGQ